MDASPGPITSAVVSVATPAVTAPLATVARVLFFESSLCACGRPADRRLRPATAPPSAPTILRI